MYWGYIHTGFWRFFLKNDRGRPKKRYPQDIHVDIIVFFDVGLTLNLQPKLPFWFYAMVSLIVFWGQGCIACIGTCCVSVGESLSWRYQAQRHHQKTTPLMQNTIIFIYIYIFTLVYLFLLDAWVTVMICICRQFFLEGHGEKRYQNDTPKHNLRALGRRSPTHPPTHLQRIPIPYVMSGSNSLKRGKEEPNKRTKQSNKFSTSPWQCSSQDADTMDWSDPVSHITGSFAGHSPSDMLKQCKFYFYWEGPRAHTHTNKHRVSFLQCSPEKRPFSSSTFGCKDFKHGECGAFVEFGPFSYALYIGGRKTWKTTGDVTVTCFHVGMPPRVKNDREPPNSATNFEDASCTLGFKSDGLVGTNQETIEICWGVPWYSINPPRRTGLGKR